MYLSPVAAQAFYEELEKIAYLQLRPFLKERLRSSTKGVRGRVRRVLGEKDPDAVRYFGRYPTSLASKHVGINVATSKPVMKLDKPYGVLKKLRRGTLGKPKPKQKVTMEEFELTPELLKSLGR